MLVLTRKLNQKIIIAGEIEVEVLSIDRVGNVRLGVVAPEDVVIDREEVHIKRMLGFSKRIESRGGRHG